MYSALVLTPVLAFVGLIFLFVPILLRLFRPSQVSELTVEWLESFHVACYAPMKGLLGSEDFEFLATQPGYSPALLRKLRRERLRIFRQYLDRMIVDFNRLYKLASLMIGQSSTDQSAVYSRLLKLRLNFGLAIMRVEISYTIARIGTRPAGVEALLQTLDAMSSQLAELSFSPSSLLTN